MNTIVIPLSISFPILIYYYYYKQKRAQQHELYEIAKLAPWLFDKCYAYEASKRKPYFWKRVTSDFPDKFEIVKRADALFPTHKEIKRPRRYDNDR